MTRRDKTRARIHDPWVQEKLAPTVKVHPFGCKRISLENGYFELFNRPNVHLVDVNETPIEEVTPSGIKTTQKEWEFDYIVCATGFDAMTGGLLQMNVVGKDGITLKEKWREGCKTYLGMGVSGFPNMSVNCLPSKNEFGWLVLTDMRFFTYGPQAPTAFCNGPSCAELQGEWIVHVMEYMREKKLKTIDATLESEAAWAEGIWTLANASLLPHAKSVRLSLTWSDYECLH